MVKTILGSHFGVGEFTTHFRTYFRGGDYDVHCKYDLDLVPWPHAFWAVERHPSPVQR